MLLLIGALAMATTVEEAFPPPEGFTRVAGQGFGASLRRLPLAAPDRPVRTHDGRAVAHRARVIEMPLVKGDLQQCADSAIRLRATWQKEHGRDVVFHATSGDPIPWSRFAAGQTPYAKGSGLAWRAGSTKRWDDYLRLVFTWAGSWSLQTFDTEAEAGDPQPGDLLVEGGFPGHVVVLLDVAVKGAQTRVLVGEGFMPAQDFHVELGPHGGWFDLGDDGLTLPHWEFSRAHLRRFE